MGFVIYLCKRLNSKFNLQIIDIFRVFTPSYLKLQSKINFCVQISEFQFSFTSNSKVICSK